MKLIASLALVALTLSVPAFAQDKTAPQDKYICEVQAGTCLKRADVLQKKMKKIEADVKKGTKTYSADDLKAIEQKLQEVEKMVDSLKEQKK